MTAARPRPFRPRRPLAGGVGAVAVALALLAGTTSCGATPAPRPPATAAATPPQTPPEPEPSAVVSSLGAVPIPPSRAPEPTPHARPGHPVLSAAGGPVLVTFGSEGTALVTLLGPEPVDRGAATSTRGGPQRRTRALLTLRVTQRTGSVSLRIGDLGVRDQTGRRIALRSRGPTAARTRAGSTSTLQVLGTFFSGAAQVTWRHRGQVLAVWTFNVELD